MKIVVTQAHIDAGKRKNIKYCPVALAWLEIVGGGSVGRSTIMRFTRHGPKQNYVLPTIAQTFISDFDKGKPVVPFEFDLEVDA